MVHATPPARPHLRFTEDGRRIREVLSLLAPRKPVHADAGAAWEAHHERWVIPDEAVDDPGFRRADWFGREAPLIVEIGSGVGEATAVLAAARPDARRPGPRGLAARRRDTLWRLADAGADNVRLCSVDAVWALEHLVEPGGLAELWTFFPDPWPKTRHHKRRLVDPAFAALAASRLAPGQRGAWRPTGSHYAEQMRTVLDAEPLLEGGPVPRWAERPVTRFERKGVDAGREIVDLVYRARSGGRVDGVRHLGVRPAARTSAAPARPGAAPGRARARAGAR